MLGESLTSAQKQYADIASASAKALLQLINNILDLSKIEAGKIDLEEIDFNGAQLVNNIMSAQTISAQAKGLKLIHSIESDVPADLRGDPERIRQVLTNLIGNAIKFTERGCVKVHVERVPEDQYLSAGQVMLRFVVKDSGIGIPHHKLEFIFEKFEQADTSTTRQYGGTGLGLAICKQLIELMGGEIGVESREGEGTTFWFTTPLSVATEVRRTGATQEDRPSQAFKASGMRVLLAEDNATNQFIAGEMLKRMDIQVDMVSNGVAAFEAVQNKAYDLVFMDLEMPQMDGLETTRRIRSWEAKNGKGQQQRLPIVAMTAHAMRGDREKCLAAGMSDHLTKPIMGAELVHVLSTWWRNADTEGAASQSLTAARAPAQQVWDKAAMLERLMNDHALLGKGVALFLEDTPPRLESLHTALREGDGARVKKIAHALKGSAANVGADTLSAAAGAIEASAEAGDFEKARTQLTELDALYGDVEQLMKPYSDTSPSA